MVGLVAFVLLAAALLRGGVVSLVYAVLALALTVNRGVGGAAPSGLMISGGHGQRRAERWLHRLSAASSAVVTVLFGSLAAAQHFASYDPGHWAKVLGWQPDVYDRRWLAQVQTYAPDPLVLLVLLVALRPAAATRWSWSCSLPRWAYPWLLGCSLAAAGVCWPSLLSLPYTIGIAGALMRWAFQPSWSLAGWLGRWRRVYAFLAVIQLIILFIAQIPTVNASRDRLKLVGIQRYLIDVPNGWFVASVAADVVFVVLALGLDVRPPTGESARLLPPPVHDGQRPLGLIKRRSSALLPLDGASALVAVGAAICTPSALGTGLLFCALSWPVKVLHRRARSLMPWMWAMLLLATSAAHAVASLVPVDKWRVYASYGIDPSVSPAVIALHTLGLTCASAALRRHRCRPVDQRPDGVGAGVFAYAWLVRFVCLTVLIAGVFVSQTQSYVLRQGLGAVCVVLLAVPYAAPTLWNPLLLSYASLVVVVRYAWAYVPVMADSHAPYGSVPTRLGLRDHDVVVGRSLRHMITALGPDAAVWAVIAVVSRYKEGRERGFPPKLALVPAMVPYASLVVVFAAVYASHPSVISMVWAIGGIAVGLAEWHTSPRSLHRRVSKVKMFVWALLTALSAVVALVRGVYVVDGVSRWFDRRHVLLSAEEWGLGHAKGTEERLRVVLGPVGVVVASSLAYAARRWMNKKEKYRENELDNDGHDNNEDNNNNIDSGISNINDNNDNVDNINIDNHHDHDFVGNDHESDSDNNIGNIVDDHGDISDNENTNDVSRCDVDPIDVNDNINGNIINGNINDHINGRNNWLIYKHVSRVCSAMVSALHVLWRFSILHIDKFAAIVLFVVALSSPSGLNALLIGMVLASLWLPTGVSALSGPLALYSCIWIVLTLLLNLKTLQVRINAHKTLWIGIRDRPWAPYASLGAAILLHVIKSSRTVAIRLKQTPLVRGNAFDGHARILLFHPTNRVSRGLNELFARYGSAIAALALLCAAFVRNNAASLPYIAASVVLVLYRPRKRDRAAMVAATDKPVLYRSSDEEEGVGASGGSNLLHDHHVHVPDDGDGVIYPSAAHKWLSSLLLLLLSVWILFQYGALVGPWPTWPLASGPPYVHSSLGDRWRRWMGIEYPRYHLLADAIALLALSRLRFSHRTAPGGPAGGRANSEVKPPLWAPFVRAVGPLTAAVVFLCGGAGGATVIGAVYGIMGLALLLLGSRRRRAWHWRCVRFYNLFVLVGLQAYQIPPLLLTSSSPLSVANVLGLRTLGARAIVSSQHGVLMDLVAAVALTLHASVARSHWSKVDRNQQYEETHAAEEQSRAEERLLVQSRARVRKVLMETRKERYRRLRRLRKQRERWTSSASVLLGEKQPLKEDSGDDTGSSDGVDMDDGVVDVDDGDVNDLVDGNGHADHADESNDRTIHDGNDNDDNENENESENEKGNDNDKDNSSGWARWYKVRAYMYATVDRISDWLWAQAQRDDDGSADVAVDNVTWRPLRFVNGLAACITINSSTIPYVAMVVNTMAQGSALAALLPLSMFTYALLCYPRPPRGYWRLCMVYQVIVITAKYVVAMSPFCTCAGLQGYTLALYPSCGDPSVCAYAQTRDQSLSWPRLVGLTSRQETSGLLRALAWDLCVLLALLYHRHALQRRGLWRERTRLELATDLVGDRSIVPNQQGHDGDGGSGGGSRGGGGDGGGDGDQHALHSSPAKRSTLTRWMKRFRRRMQVTLSARVDLYTWRFAIDLASVLLMVVAPRAFLGISEQQLKQSLQQNDLPRSYVMLLFGMFMLIVTQRMLYLRRSVFVSGLLLVARAVVFTGLLLFYFPLQADNPFVRTWSLIAFYGLRAIQWSLSAIQLRYGYPVDAHTEFLTRRYGRLRYVGYIAYRAVPFLFELRSLLDWALTPTSLEFFQWVTLEDTFGSMWLVRQAKRWQRERHRTPGRPRPWSEKLLTGIGLFLVLVLVLWFPLFLLSGALGHERNPIGEARVEVAVRGWPPLWSSSVIKGLEGPLGGPWDRALRRAVPQLSPDDASNAQVVATTAYSDSLWAVAPPSVASMELSLRDASAMLPELSVRMVVQRAKPESAQSADGESSRVLAAGEAQGLRAVLRGQQPSVEVMAAVPRLVRAGLSSDLSVPRANTWATVRLSLNRTTAPLTGAPVQFWQVEDVTGLGGAIASRGGPQIVVVSQRVPAGVGVSLATTGMVGLYVGVVLSVGRFLRMFVTGLMKDTMFRDLPDSGPIVELCRDVVHARLDGDLALEEALYGEVVEVLRSPERMIELTKLKQE